MLLTLVVQKWGTEEVAAWLDLLNLGEYKEIFIRHDIRGAELLHLERRDLKVFPLCYSSVLKFSSCKTDSFLLHLTQFYSKGSDHVDSLSSITGVLVLWARTRSDSSMS